MLLFIRTVLLVLASAAALIPAFALDASPEGAPVPAPSPAFVAPLTLDDAITLAAEHLPFYQAARLRVASTEALYNAALGPYFPRFDAAAAYRRFYTSAEDFDTRNYELSLSYLLYDGGERRANRTLARLNLENDRLEVRNTLLELYYAVRTAFYTALAQQELVTQRRVQRGDAQTDYEVAQGRYKFGVARLSDVLQASVRLEQARFNLIQAEGDLVKAFSDLNSLVGRPLESSYALAGTLDPEVKLPELRYFYEAALDKPEVLQAENDIRRAEQNQALVRSTFKPLVTAEAAYQRTSGGIFRTSFPDQRFAGLTATWNIFELGKFFRYKSARIEKDIAAQQLSEVKRQLLLAVNRAYEDVQISSNQIGVARQQVKQAEQNYEQAYGEYKVGKGDILSLVQAESFLAEAREQLITARLNFILSLSLLQRTAGTPWTGR